MYDIGEQWAAYEDLIDAVADRVAQEGEAAESAIDPELLDLCGSSKDYKDVMVKARKRLAVSP